MSYRSIFYMVFYALCGTCIYSFGGSDGSTRVSHLSPTGSIIGFLPVLPQERAINGLLKMTLHSFDSQHQLETTFQSIFARPFQKVGIVCKSLSKNIFRSVLHQEVCVSHGTIYWQELLTSSGDLEKRPVVDGKQKERETEILLLKKDQEIKELEMRRQRAIRTGILVGLLLTLLLVLGLLHRYLYIKKMVSVLEEKNEVIEKKNQELELKNTELYDAAISDTLTGAYNRYALVGFLKGEISKVERYNWDLSFIMIDLDHFKCINDSFGHQVGDRVLQDFSNAVKSVLREEDFLVRYGGDEFMVILPSTNQDQAYHVTEKIREKIELTAFTGLSPEDNVTFSAGVAGYDRNIHSSADAMITCADAALYRAKIGGRNKILIYTEDMEDLTLN